ncbi:hypothetical protein KIL84_012524, partial [Mauremys mutica]
GTTLEFPVFVNSGLFVSDNMLAAQKSHWNERHTCLQQRLSKEQEISVPRLQSCSMSYPDPVPLYSPTAH